MPAPLAVRERLCYIRNMTPFDWRTEAKMSLRDVAKKLDVAPSTVLRHERGARVSVEDAMAWQTMTGGLVRPEDFEAVRLARAKRNGRARRTA